MKSNGGMTDAQRRLAGYYRSNPATKAPQANQKTVRVKKTPNRKPQRKSSLPTSAQPVAHYGPNQANGYLVQVQGRSRQDVKATPQDQ